MEVNFFEGGFNTNPGGASDNYSDEYGSDDDEIDDSSYQTFCNKKNVGELLMAFSGGSSGGDFGELTSHHNRRIFNSLIMVVIAPMINETSLPINPPQAKNGATADSQGKVINLEISAEGLIAINNKKLSPDPIALKMLTL